MFFSRLRNRGFKKIWLRKKFATLKYEDREKLMTEKEPDSSFSHSACQIVLEEKAESLKVKRSRLADPCLSHNDNTTKNLFPMETHRIKRGMFSGHYNQEVQMLSPQHQSADLSNIVIQGLPWEKLHPRIFLQKQKTTPTEAETTRSTTMAKEDMEKDEEDR